MFYLHGTRTSAFWITAAAILLLFYFAPVLPAQESESEESSAADKEEQQKEKEEEEEELKSLREKRAQTLQYGIDSQIIGLVDQLKEEKNDRHNETLVDVFERTSNPKLQSKIAEFFTSRESGALKESAYEKLKDYDEQRIDLVTSITNYLQDYQDDDTTELFRKMTEDPRNQVAQKAVIALGNSKKSEYTETLLKLYEESASESLKSAALEALGKLGSKEAVDLLTEVVRDDDNSKSLRWKACSALGKIGGPEVLDTIEYLFGEQDPYLRMYAVQALSNFDSQRSRELLMEALRDDFWRVRQAAAASLGELGAGEAVPILKFKAEHDPERNNVAVAAVEALGKIGGGESFSFLRDFFANGDVPFNLRMTAMRTLVENDLRGSLKTLRKVIDEEWDEENSRILEYTCKELSTTENRILQPLYKKMLDHSANFHIPIYGLRGIRLNNLRALKSEVKELTGEEHNRHIRELAKSVLEEL